MAQATVAQAINFTRSDLNEVANIAIAKVGNDDRLHRAIERALVNLATGRFSYDGQQVILHSASGDGIYHISTKEPMNCSCRGRAKGYKCWHIVAARLIVRAAEHRARAEQARALCPMCGAPIEGRQYYIGGKGYCFFEVCSGDGSHYSKRAA